MQIPELDSGSFVQVKMLGEFSIWFAGRQITQNKGRVNRVWLLIEYLIANRKKDISTDRMIEALWNDDECGNPLNALKNLVYRARELLKELLPDDSHTEFIIFARNTYAWNNSLPCKIDTEQLEACWKDASNTNRSLEERIKKYMEALNIYKGEFLPKSSFYDWVISANVHYSTIYNECVIHVCNLMMGDHRFGDIIKVCENALTYSVYEEEIHKILLYAYINTNQFNKALKHYNYVSNLIYKEFGIDISSSFADIFKQIKGSLTNIELDLSVIKNDLKEACEERGAFYCDYDVFKSFYRVKVRSVCRTSQSVYLALFTLSDHSGHVSDSETNKTAREILKAAIISSLRKGDVVSSYSSMQFIVMLPMINFENVETVVNRIKTSFLSYYRKDDIQIMTKISPVESGDDLILTDALNGEMVLKSGE